jgi:TonB family protein
MTVWQAFTCSPEIQTLGWTLINFLWQGTLIALVFKSALTALRHHRANLRYWTAAATLVLLMIVPLLTFCRPHEAPAPTHSHVVAGQTMTNMNPALPVMSVDARSVSSVQRAPTSPQSKPDSAMLRLERWTRELEARLPDVLPSWLAAFWILGIVVTGIRALGGLIQANLLKNGAREFSPDSNIRYFILTSGAAGRVRLLESARISVPTVIGWLRPAVLFPAGAEIETNHLQALLAHELEHVRRCDYLVNLLQSAIEALLFFHPAVWWVSAQIRTERECCCDDAAVKTCGDLRLYLRALSEAEHRRSGTKLAVALSGTSLLHRIRRLTKMRTVQSNHWKTRSAGISAFAVLLIFSAAAILLAFIPVQAEQTTTQASTQEVKVKVPKPAPTVSSKQVSEAPVPRRVTITKSEVQQSPQAELAPQQGQQEKITGTILDPTGGVIPGAFISIFDAQTNELLATTPSAANGSFEIVPPAGNYYIQVALPGFQTQVFSKSQLGPSPLMIEMELGQIKEVVTVTTAAPTTASPRAKREPIRVGGSLVPPKLVKRADPLYPPEARDANVEGAVVVSALIDTEGNVTNPVVLSGHHLLWDAALTCVGQWHYQPVLLNGEPRPMRLSITIVFKLQRWN